MANLFWSICEFSEQAIVLHPKAQGHGLSTKMIKTIAEEVKTRYLTAKTHNPRVYETLTKLACGEGGFYPKIDTNIPESVYELVRKNEFISMADENLIVIEAYPDEKIMQSFRNRDIFRIFKHLNKHDAQAIVVKLA